MEFTVIPGRIQMERFIPVENYRKKGNNFRGISFFWLLLEFPEISVPFVHTCTSARLLAVILPRKNAKHLNDGGRFPNVYHYNVFRCLSVVLADVLEHYCSPVGENKLSFVVGTCFFLLLLWFGLPACFRLSYIEGKLCGCWLLIFLTKCGCWNSQTDEIVAMFSKKY